MKLSNIPQDISAEVLVNYFTQDDCSVEFHGAHKRNAYQDILEKGDLDEKLTFGLCRNSLYDILPEALFHPTDRFDGIPANEYEERFSEECRKSQEEEEAARAFFKIYDEFIFKLSCIIARIKESYSDDSVVAEMICDKIEDRYRNNKFIRQAMPFVPLCKKLRGSKFFLTLMLRKVFMDEGLHLEILDRAVEIEDIESRYCCNLDEEEDISSTFLGNKFEEDILEYVISYWDEESCDENFLSFVKDLDVFREFLDDYFMAIGSRIVFKVVADAPPVVLSDDEGYNYLNYNTNI